jgi:hypothetical protein
VPRLVRAERRDGRKRYMVVGGERGAVTCGLFNGMPQSLVIHSPVGLDHRWERNVESCMWLEMGCWFLSAWNEDSVRQELGALCGSPDEETSWRLLENAYRDYLEAGR